ncbi:MAG TPA: pyridoxamine 5'-phosphate oxidase family protein [Candidatus Binatia bacterium]|nr:pyridoxamine 5'-phosphate oxidase family protein [Candidatus Binatia bacterium]
MRRKKPAGLKRQVAEFVELERVCRVATSGATGMPHVVPVCHVWSGGKVIFGSGHRGRKVKNLAENPRVTIVVDAYSDAWSTLRGVMIQGRAEVFARGPRFRRGRDLLYRKYPHYSRDAALSPSDSVIIEVTPTRVFSWGFD